MHPSIDENTKEYLERIKQIHLSILTLITELYLMDLNRQENAGLVGYTLDILLQTAESVEIIFEKIPDHLLKLFVEELKISFPESRILHKLQSN